MNLGRIITVATCVSFPVIIVLMATIPEPPAKRGVSPATQPTSREAPATTPAVGRAALPPPFPPPPQPRVLFDAIRQVESGGDDGAVGDSGRSVGPYQCGLAAWLDGRGRRQDWPRMAYCRPAVERAMEAYWLRYGAVTDEQKARIWNGGPRGMAKTATLAYWLKVNAAAGAEPVGKR